MTALDLTRSGLVAQYGDIDLGQHYFSKWHVARGPQIITWTNAGLQSASFHKKCSLT